MSSSIAENRRKHVTTACATCRKSRVKCDGSHPKCGTCKQRRRTCIYQHEEDKRRHAISTRMAVEVLSARITELETFISQNALTVPVADPKVVNLILRHSGHQDSLSKQLIHPSHEDLFESFPVQVSSKPCQLVASSPSNYNSNETSMRSKSAQEFELEADTTFQFQETGSFGGFNFPDWAVDFSMFSSLDNEILPTDAGTVYSSSISTPPETHLPPFLHDWHLPYGLQDLPYHDSSIPNSADREDVDVRLSDTKGSLRNFADGDLRYFGAGSNVDLLDTELPFDDVNTLNRRGTRMIEEAGLRQIIEPKLVNHFIDLYFAWQDSSFHVVDRDAYERQREEYAADPNKSRSYSEALTNIMCAFGAMYEPRKGKDLPQPACDFFVQRAKVWLDVELSHPRVATVQAMAILSSYEGAVGRDTRGWVYSGMAMRLSYDLGLHIDVGPYVRAGRLGIQEAESRKAAFWGSFVIDQLWDHYLGRPSFGINSDKITVEKPRKVVEASKPRSWVPHGLPDLRQIMQPENDLVNLVLEQRVLLREIMTVLTPILYEHEREPGTMLHLLVEKTVVRLETWKTNLHPYLQINLEEATTPLPHVILLHMHYHQYLIHIHRPFVSKHRLSPFPTKYLHARRVCIDSAVAIANLVQRYESYYTLRYINNEAICIIFSTAVILVFASVSDFEGHDNRSLVAHLSTCCNALAELGKIYEHASRTLDILLRLKRQWQAKLLVSMGT